MGQSRFALESLAVLPVIHGLTFIFRALGLSYLEVTIALLGSRREQVVPIRNFAALLALVATASLVTIAYTPLAVVWFHDVSGLSVELANFALLPTRILAVFPALSSGAASPARDPLTCQTDTSDYLVHRAGSGRRGRDIDHRHPRTRRNRCHRSGRSDLGGTDPGHVVATAAMPRCAASRASPGHRAQRALARG